MTTTPASTDLVTFTIDGIEVSVPKGTLVIRAAEQVGIQIPRFCDHPLLEPVGACRQCLVEVALPGPDGDLRQMQGPPGRMKPQTSCTLVASEGMQVQTQVSSPGAAKAQTGMLEMLLVNHPLDCPVCDKGGECPLQNQAMSNGPAESRFWASGGVKRTFPKPISLSAQVLLDRERCVLCARCTRFSQEIAGDPFIALLERGALQQVGIAAGEPLDSYFSGNTIQICPVGALTSVDYRFRARPFDLVSTPSVAEHDACGAAIRVDHRRGKVMRRLAGNDPEVNEEWISDKDRFAFAWARGRTRLTHPQVREGGVLRPASWTEAFAVAARGLARALDGVARDADTGAEPTRGVGVLTGGRLTLEDAYAYAKFARVSLGTNDIDFRARVHSAGEADFLAAHVAGRPSPTYADLDAASTVVLVGLEPEEEAATLFLRLRKAVRHGTRVVSLASRSSSGLRKLSGRLVPTVPGDEAEALRALATESAFGADTVLLVGERMAAHPDALWAVARLAGSTGARFAWVPRRAGDRGAVEAGCLPGLLPGARPVADAAARGDLAAAWGVDTLPDTPGRDGDAVVEALVARDLAAVVVAGVDPDDTADPDAFRSALAAAGFVVSLEVNATSVTEVADVVFPVAPVTDRAGTFLTWDGRAREFGAVFDDPRTLPDLRILAGVSEELARLGHGTPLGFRTTPEARTEMSGLGRSNSSTVGTPSSVAVGTESPSQPRGGAGDRSSAGGVEGLPGQPTSTSQGGPTSSIERVLDSWQLLLGDGALLAGATSLLATARPAQVRLDEVTLAALGNPGRVTVTGPRGSVTLPVRVADQVPGTVWLPGRSFGRGLLAEVGRPGDRVTVSAATPQEEL